MSSLSDDLIRNEELLSRILPTHNLGSKKSWWIGLYKAFTKEGDLIEYLRSPKTTPAFDEHEALFIEFGLPTVKQIVSRYVQNNPRSINDKLRLESLIVGARYKSRDICSLAKNQNINLGMYMGRELNGRVVAILKATINGTRFRTAGYDDEWLDPDKTKMKYCLKREPMTNLFEFSGKENKAIFDGLITDMPVPIYLFANEEYEKDYVFYGIFEANSLSDDRKSFTLVNSGERLRKENFYEYKKFIDEYVNSDFNSIAASTPILLEKNLPSGAKMHIGTASHEHGGNPDYLQLQEKLKILGSFGEDKALQFERERVAKFSPDYAKQVRKVQLDREGYDIATFDLDGKTIKPIKLEVKTTTSSNGLSPFFMSSNEKSVMESNPKDYWLYRIFNIHSTTPSFYSLKSDVKESIILTPKEYTCTFR